jgi:amino acid transporter
MEDIKKGHGPGSAEYTYDAKEGGGGATTDVASSSEGETIVENVDDLKRRLSGRQIQMMAIGGSIGTALFVSIGSGLTTGGPGSLLIAFTLYCVFMAAVNSCMAEMAVFMPVSGSFVRMGGKWVDEAFGFMLGVSNTTSLFLCHWS